MVAQLATFAFLGIDARPVDVQVQISGGANAFSIVGLPDKAVSEARDRVRGALSAIGIGLPPKRVTINLAPADLPKEGAHFDLPIALALMAEAGAAPKDAIADFAVLGELGLDGSIRKINGVLPAAIAANSQDLGLICPAANGTEATWAGNGLKILAPASIIQLINHFKGTQLLTRPQASSPNNIAPTNDKSADDKSGITGPLENSGDVKPFLDLSDVKGQETAKRALEVAAAGGHNLLMIGPPGAGKSMLASRLPNLLPPLSPEEMLDVSMIQSVAGLLQNGAIAKERPFRAPHHSASMAAMVGGGTKAKPGEASLAHHGVLFLDELPEFSPQVIDSLRQPLETGDVMIARANMHVRYPARFQLIAAMNPCRCGYGHGDGRTCSRGPKCSASYQARISGPLLDRIDMTVNLAPVTAADLLAATQGERTQDVASRVASARQAARERRTQSTGAYALNSALPDGVIADFATPDPEGIQLLARATETLGFSARAYHRVLKLSRTLADLDGSDGVRRRHVAEAISYRQSNEQSAAPPSVIQPNTAQAFRVS
ncbi:MAG: YifB family Mg chelatase-like AAA ATPase [Pseudomonadota bacterium]